MLVAKIGEGQAVVRTDANDDATERREIALAIGEVGRLPGAAGGVGARIEIQHDMVRAQHVGQFEHLHVGVGQRELRCPVARAQRRLGGSRRCRPVAPPNPTGAAH